MTVSDIRDNCGFDEPDAEVARAFAKANVEQAIRESPPELNTRENGFARKLQSLNANPTSKLRQLHALADEVMTHFAPRAPCRAGCAGCCHIDVKIHPVEAHYIASNTGKRLRAVPGPARSFHGSPCVFLKDGRCMIYEVRPLVCRTHLAMTRTAFWCQPERSLTEKFPMMMFSGLQAGLHVIVQQSGDVRSYDIRQLFEAV